jgi:hypothetical protein
MKEMLTSLPNITKLSLINSIMELFSNFSRENISRTCSWFRSSQQEVVAADGEFICFM